MKLFQRMNGKRTAAITYALALLIGGALFMVYYPLETTIVTLFAISVFWLDRQQSPQGE